MSDTEVDASLQEMQTNLWSLISNLKRMRQMRTEDGPWSDEDLRNLIREMREHVRTLHRDIKVLEDTEIRDLRAAADMNPSQAHAMRYRRQAHGLLRDQRRRAATVRRATEPGQRAREAVRAALNRRRPAR